MRLPVRPVLLVALLLLALPAAAAAAKKRPKPAPCPPAQYAVDGAPLGATGVTSDTIEVGALAGVGDSCPLAAPVRARTSRKGVTTVRARWNACPGFTGPVRLRARIVDGCTRLAGKVRARRHRRAVTATRADCGDGILDAAAPPTPYLPTRESLASHEIPRWFRDAKLGIMIHWGIFTIPAWAPLTIDPHEWLCCGKLIEPPDFGAPFFTNIPYTEWYWNSILIDGSPAQQHHAATYGADYPYEAFRPQFDAAAAPWSGEAWADLFREAGARYVVFVTKHHDGYSLWPTAVPHPTRTGWHTTRDYVGELDGAVRRRCMRMGLYFSGGLDWSVKAGPIVTSLDGAVVAPTTPEYTAFADGQWRELIARYRPSVLWNDITYPSEDAALRLFADYYNGQPDGLVNDRFSILPGLTHHDYSTPEFSVVADVSPRTFETVRGMGRGFGYNRNESDATLDSADALIHLLADVVSRNGNLLLNVGPMADGTIPAAQVDRLRAIGAWLGTNGAAIFASRPATTPEATTADGTPVRFTLGADGTTRYAILLGPLPAGTVAFPLADGAPGRVRLLGDDAPLDWTLDGGVLRITVPATLAGRANPVLALAAP
ncbi:MAG: alpha-L-fucosidase [bacterium]|nr:alpha-L-fucosidase [bacterium]